MMHTMLQRQTTNSSESGTTHVFGLSDGDSKILLHSIYINDKNTVFEIIDRIESKTMPHFVFDYTGSNSGLGYESPVPMHPDALKNFKYSLCPIVQAILVDGDIEMFRVSVLKLRSKMPLDEIYNLHMSRIILNKLLPHADIIFSIPDYLSNSLQLLRVLHETGFFTRAVGYNYDRIMKELKFVLSGQYYAYNPHSDSTKVFFALIDSVPEFKNFYQHIPVADLPFRLDFVKTSYNYWLNVDSEKITKKSWSFIPVMNTSYDVLPQSEILAFLYSKGRNPHQDMCRLRVDYRLLIHTFAFKQFTDFKYYLRLATHYRDKVVIDNNSRKFNLRYDEATIKSINTILDFWRLSNKANTPKTYLSRTILKEKYDLEYVCFSKDEATVVSDSLESILPTYIVDMILTN